MEIAELKATKTAPAKACEFIAACEFKAGKETDVGNLPVTLKARSKDALEHWYWGKCVHDFGGMRAPKKGIIDWEHGEVIGHFDRAEVTEYGLELSGYITPVTDRAKEVAALMKAGNPMQASIKFGDQDLSVEYIPEETKTQINGVEYEGGLVVFRAWDLRGVAVCPYGYDANTESSLLSDKGKREIKVNFLQGVNDMSDAEKKVEEPEVKEPETKQGEEKKPEAEGQEGKAEEQQKEAAPEVEPENASPAELAKIYKAEFGAALGMEYMANGLTIEDARKEFCKTLKKENAELKAKFAAKVEAEKPAESEGESGVEFSESGSGKVEFTAEGGYAVI